MNQIVENDDINLYLCEDDIKLKILRELNTYIPFLMKGLWQSPKLIALIIEHTDINVLKENLAPFFVHNFYENILSYDCIEDNLIYVLTLLMQSEIKNLNDINQKDKFLIDTPCGIMFDEIYKKIEIQMYLNKITKNAIEYLEKNYSNQKLDYNLNKIINELKSSLPNKNENKNNKRFEDFNKKYLENLDESSIKKLIEENKNNKIMFEFLNSKLSLFSNNSKQNFSNKNFLTFCNGYKNSDELINLYASKFYIAIDFIEQIIKNILNEICSMPKSIKKICGIIFELIEQKFPNINSIDKYFFVINLFFEKLLIPFLSNRNIFSYISDNTLYNLELICIILKKCINGDLFSSDDSEFSFSPFNWFTIYNIENIVNLYQNMTKIQLPLYIENLINNKLSSDFEYDFFDENPDKIAHIKSIIYNINQINALIIAIDKNKNLIFVDNKNQTVKKTVERLTLKKNMNLIENIINEEKQNIEKYNQRKNNKKEKKKEEEFQKPKIRYFLFSELCLNKKYEKYLKVRTHDYFYIKPNKESKEENDIIKFKNYLVYLLNKCKHLEKSDFFENQINSTEDIINEIYYSLSNLEVDDNNLLRLSAEYLIEHLKKIHEDSRESYLKKIIDELEKEIDESIKGIDFSIFVIINEILKGHNINQTNNEKYFEILEEYEINNEIRKIAKEYFIPVDIIFDYKNNIINKFEIKESSFKEKEKEKEDKIKKYEKSNKVKLCLNIEGFIKIFPDFTKYQLNDENDTDIFVLQQKIGMPNELNKFIDIIKEKLTTYNKININKIMDKLYDYIITNIYEKCFPIQPSKFEKDLFKKCISLSWTKIHHYKIIKNEYFLGNREKEISDFIKLFVQEKSLKEKSKILEKIFELIDSLIKFENMPNTSYTFIDDEMPLLNYFVIKAQALFFYTNLRFIEIYHKENENIRTQINMLKVICELIPKMNYEYFKNISLELFEKKSNEALKNYNVK